jgi:hypothetical protein
MVRRLNPSAGRELRSPLKIDLCPVPHTPRGRDLLRSRYGDTSCREGPYYVLELAGEARADPQREATTVVIGIHPFVVGTPDGAAALRRVLTRLEADDAVWLTDTAAILKAATN